jgi:ATP-dependent Clp protease ATP-binding subunit ClpC
MGNEIEKEKIDGIPGVLVGGTFWYWGEDVTSITLALRKIRNRVQRIINYLVFFVLFLSLAGFVIPVVMTYQNVVLTSAFWREPNLVIASLLFASLAVQFLIYRRISYKHSQEQLPKLKKGESPEARVIPSLAALERKKRIEHIASEETRQVIEEAYLLAKQAGHSHVDPIHLFVGSLSTKPVRMLFMRLGISFDSIKDALRRRMHQLPPGETVFGPDAQMILARATENSFVHSRPTLGAVEVFIESYKADLYLQELLSSIKIEPSHVDDVVAWVRIHEQLIDRYSTFRKAAAYKPTKNMDRAYTAVETPFLDSVSRDLTVAAIRGQLPFLVGREDEVSNLLRAIEGGNQSVLLVGEHGVGKDAVIHGIAEMMVAEDVPEVLQDKRLLSLDIPMIVSSEGGSGAEERLLHALQEVGRSGNIVLVIENIDRLIGSGGVDLAAVLAGELEKGYTFVLATTTPQAYSSTVERSVIGTKLEKVDILEPERGDAILILESRVGAIENKHKVVFTYQSVAALIDYSSRYMHETFLPEKAMVLANELALHVAKRGKEWAHIRSEDVAEIVSQKTNIPITDVTTDESDKLLHLEERMHERLIGQDDAVKAVAAALRRARVKLRSEDRPIANFLFLGPTGVGKTELAKTTAEVYFGQEQSMLRFDMSEYQEKSAIYRLIGETGEGGFLTEAVRKNPFSLLLLDELEKAHPNILNVFLQVMDDGRLTDGAGRTIDFTNVIIIATSNAATQYIHDAVDAGTSQEEMKTQMMEHELKSVYRPEFLNRFDGVMIFKPLTQEDVVAIAYLMIKKVAKRLEAKGIHFKATDDAVHELAKKGYDPKFGARPLRRVIQEDVDNAVANHLLKGDATRRDTLTLEAGGAIRVEKAEEL